MRTDFSTPSNTLPFSITIESKHPVSLVPIQTHNRLMQPPLRILLPMRWQRIINPHRPTFLLEDGENALLIRSRSAIFLDYSVAKCQSI